MKTPKAVIITLILIIVVLAGLIIYLLGVRPAISSYAVRLQSEGYAYAFAQIMQQAATSCQAVPLTLGNQTVQVINVECLPPELFQQPQVEE